jgi:hypothetical protein
VAAGINTGRILIMCIVRELIIKYKSLDVDFWNGKTSCILMESREMWRDQGEAVRRFG